MLLDVIVLDCIVQRAMECQVGSRGAAQELQDKAIVSFHSVCRHVHSGGGFLSKRHALNLFVPPLFAFGIEEEKGSNMSSRDYAFFSGGGGEKRWN